MTPDIHLLPFGTVDFSELRAGVAFEQRSVCVYGKVHPQPRLTKWYGPVAYRYSGLEWPVEALPRLLEELLGRVGALTGERFNSVLCNLYRGGRDCVGWHADDEPIFGGDPVVASLSFGASRTFRLRRKADRKVKREFELGDGTLLVMGRGVQPGWEHSLPRTARSVGERINLTFRYIPES